MEKNSVSQEKDLDQSSLSSLVSNLEEYKKNLTRLTKKINGASLFIVYKTGSGGSPEFIKLKTPNEILRRAKQVNNIFGQNGLINTASKHIENYALCLVYLGHFKKAKLLFDAIYQERLTVKLSRPLKETYRERPENLLFLHKKKKELIYQSEATADRPGQLGYEGIYQYALACRKLGYDQGAKLLFAEIVEKIDARCPPDRLQCVRVLAIQSLIEMGVIYVGEIFLADELKNAKLYQY